MTYLAVFDWNGTLFDDTQATLQATNAVLAKFDIAPIDLNTLQENFSFPLIHFYERMGVSPDTYLQRTEEEGAAYLHAYEGCYDTCRIADGTFDLLQWLEEAGFHSMVLSNHLQSHLDADVTRLGIAPYMRHISGNAERATITQGLSKQIRLEAYLETHGYDPAKTFIIGDSHEEPELAKRLGILGISVAGGLLSAQRLEKYKADYIVQSLTEVRPLIEKHWKL